MTAVVAVLLVLGALAVAVAAFFAWVLFWPTKRGPFKHGQERSYPTSSNHHAPPVPREHRGPFAAAMKRADEEAEAQAKIVCQFCHEAGHVTVRRFKKDKRLSATRLVGGIATAGGSWAVAGVTKKGWITRLTCSNCGMTWDL